MRILSLTSSRFYGGPERQMLGLAVAARPMIETVFASFSEENRCHSFLSRVAENGFQACQLEHDTPRLYGAYRELKALIRETGAQVLCCQGYKADLIGWLAARSLRIPVISVSRGWTSECRRVRAYEWIDKRMLSRMDKVVCVSSAHARRIAGAGVPLERIEVIPNSIFVDRFKTPKVEYRRRLLEVFPAEEQSNLQYVVGAAGRLSPEKGFDVLVDAARLVMENRNDVGFVLFGDGPLREALSAQIQRSGISNRFKLYGFCDELDCFMPHFDLFAQSSHTEGLPNVLLEAAAAGVPVVATNVGGTAEVVVQEGTGLLIPPNDPQALATGLHRLLTDHALGAAMKRQAPEHVGRQFTFVAQAEAYRSVLKALVASLSNTAPASFVAN